MRNSKKEPRKRVRSLDEASWRDGVSFLLDLNLRSLMIRCPQCKQAGTAITKWTKGPKIKPLYLAHKDGEDTPRFCALQDDEADVVRGRIALREEDLKKLIESCDVYVLFSGGLDSLCTLHYSRAVASSIGRDVRAIHVDTTAGFPEVTSYVRTVCRQLGVDLAVVRPEIDYFTLAKKWGIPAVNSRWCCRELKIRPLTELLTEKSDPKIVIDGIRAAESSVRAKYLPVWFHPSFECLSVSPIFHWDDETVASYIKAREIDPGPSAPLGCSGECWCGAYKTKSDFEALLRLHPEIYQKLIEVEESNKHGFTFIYENGTRTSLRQLEAKITQSEE